MIYLPSAVHNTNLSPVTNFVLSRQTYAQTIL